MKFLISVTKEDIKNGQPRNGAKCPIALAVARKFQSDYARWYYDGGYYRNDDEIGYHLRPCSTKPKAFVSKFDNQKTVRPFKFYAKVSKSIV